MSEPCLVPTNHLLPILADAMALLEPAIARSVGRWGVGDVAAALLTGQMHLWVSLDDGKIECACAVRFIDYPRMRACGLQFIGGKFPPNWDEFEARVTEWAKANGCRELESYARKGWLRRLRHWKPTWTFISRPI